MNDPRNRTRAQALQWPEPPERETMGIAWRDLRLFGRERERCTAEVQRLQIAIHRVDLPAKDVRGGRRTGEDLEHGQLADRHEQERRPMLRQLHRSRQLVR